LGKAYGVALERMKAQDGEKTKLAIAALMWTYHSDWLLQADEFCHELAVEIGTTNFDPENLPPIGALLDCCQGLNTVDKEASTLRLIHFTFQEYLRAQPDPFSRLHSTIAETCLTSLNSQQVKDLSSDPLFDHQSMPFLKITLRIFLRD